ncbi:MAG: 4Fe-4S dicluster domain-containing protein [Gordonibacter sp.]|uniref:4Fe-4S dicluster domain-containing protein n=1 Tax=Gordonibacter sp. TaxID=1968902 RepID=UPI002FCBF0AC
MPANNPTRRTFVIGGAALLASIAVGADIRPLVTEADMLRPPGSLPEDAFMARCIKCERCISVCPTDVLEPVGIEGGLLQARTPRLTFANDSCTFCDLCRQVCPTVAIGLVDPWAPDQGRIGAAILHEDRCLAFLETDSCGICVDACPYEALSFDAGRRPVVDEAKCNGCGECVKICPANVFTSFSGGKARGIEVVTEKTLQKEKDAR